MDDPEAQRLAEAAQRDQLRALLHDPETSLTPRGFDELHDWIAHQERAAGPAEEVLHPSPRELEQDLQRRRLQEMLAQMLGMPVREMMRLTPRPPDDPAP